MKRARPIENRALNGRMGEPPKVSATQDYSFMEPFVSAAEIARYLSLSPRTVAKMARDGRLPAHRISGSKRKTWRFLISEVAALITSGVQE
jgi:excisionase family DNA binding protein